jgi:hypothetical protein
MIKKKTLEKIKKYAELRGALDERLKESILVEIYEKASNKERVLFNKEMDTYIKAVESGSIQPGMPITVATLKS